MIVYTQRTDGISTSTLISRIAERADEFINDDPQPCTPSEDDEDGSGGHSVAADGRKTPELASPTRLRHSTGKGPLA